MLQSELDISSASVKVEVNTYLEEEMPMLTETKKRRHFTAEQKVAILRQHLLDRVPVSDLCDQHSLRPNRLYQWQKQFFENGAAAFDRGGSASTQRVDREKAALKAKLAQKDEVIAEIMASHVALKKSLGAI